MRPVAEMPPPRPLRTKTRTRPNDPPVDFGADGMPVDRTLCPHCQGKAPRCPICDGSGLVCPTCRGFHMLRHDTDPERPATLIGCPDCTDWLDQGQHRWNASDQPVYQRVRAREEAAIDYALRRKGAA